MRGYEYLIPVVIVKDQKVQMIAGVTQQKNHMILKLDHMIV